MHRNLVALAVLTSTLVLPCWAGPIVKRSISGPVIRINFPDPALWQLGENDWYAMATSNVDQSRHVQIARSSDFENWTVLDKDALPRVGRWASQSSPNVWAPSVRQRDDGSFVLYYSATTRWNDRIHCVGTAVASNIEGPYEPRSRPFVCPTADGGAIDAAFYQDYDGTKYITYKVDGNAIGNGGDCNNGIPPIRSTPLMLQRVSDDWLSTVGDPVVILDRIDEDGPLVEAPKLMRADNGAYILFYSSGCFQASTYDVKYASAPSIAGPYTRKGELLGTGVYGLDGPGGFEPARDRSHVVFHANINGAGSDRGMWVGRINIDGDTVTI